MRKCLWQLRNIFIAFVLIVPFMHVSPTYADGSISANGYSLKYAIGQGMIVGPDGNFWYGQQDSRVTASVCTVSPEALESNVGAGTCYPVPGNSKSITSLVSGSDGNVWFTTVYGIGRVTPTGTMLTGYTPGDGSIVLGAALGSDGNVWFTDSGSGGTGGAGYITPEGAVTTYDLPSGVEPDYMTAGPDGNLWFTISSPLSSPASIGKITTTGQVTVYPIPTDYANSNTLYLTAGPDGNVWFPTDYVSGGTTTIYMDSITPDGVVSGYQLPAQVLNVGALTSGPDGNVWYTADGVINDNGNTAATTYVGNVTPSGVVTQYSTPLLGGGAGKILIGSDGNLWAAVDQSTGTAQSKMYQLGAGILAPTDLSIVSPTRNPAMLSWGAVVGATYYNVYRNGSLIDTISSSNTSYADSTALEGVNSYYVTAQNGADESGPSNTVNVVYDKTKPTASFTTPSSFTGPFTTGPIVSITASDSGSGLGLMAIHVYNSSNQLLTTCGSATPAQLVTGAMSCNTSSLAPGTYYIKAGATDKAGNNQTILSGNFTITG